jgi:hypothetical protein
MALYREQMDKETSRCSVPGCTSGRHDGPIFFHSACHPDEPTWASYRGGILTVTCRVCEHVVISVHVAREPESRRWFARRGE